MGPRPISRGVAERAGRCRGLHIASMGPRPISRGVNKSGTNPMFIHSASMGPRPISRGVGEGVLLGVDDGVRFNGAATDQSRSDFTTSDGMIHPNLLQWGRDRSVAECRRIRG